MSKRTAVFWPRNAGRSAAAGREVRLARREVLGLLGGLLTLLLGAPGCARYRFGNEALFPPDIHTVYVPMFTSDSFRRNLGERLSEAVKKEIENRTPYKLVNTPEADSVLSGRIVRDTKRLTVETPTDEPRELEINFVVEVTWVDRRGELLAQQGLTLPPSIVQFSSAAPVRPETGQSITTGQQEVLERLATQIVDLMEAPW
ncbi:MAG: LptE family protein [Planctomycetaceae bacterium]|nr:LptE family protein [Planctomycetaceae bacterium]